MRKLLVIALAFGAALPLTLAPAPVTAEEDGDDLLERPRHVTPRTEQAIERGVRWLARAQRRDGSFREGGGSGAYPAAMTALAGMAFLGHGDTPTRGKYAANVRRAVQYLTHPRQAQRNGLISGGGGEESRSMYGHGFATMFLACCLGEEGDPRLEDRIKVVLRKAIELTDRSQSAAGGWLYTPDQNGDEGSVTITQVQALRACRNAGMSVPVRVIRKAVGYIEASQQPDGGIAYNAGGSGSQPAITAAAVAVLYNAGAYDSPAAERCMAYCKRNLQVAGGGRGFGHYFYTHLYLAQAYWQASVTEPQLWDRYYPAIRDQLLRMQARDGSWQGDGVGNVYGTAIAVTVLTLPYERLPLYMR
jgi:hypothetical protein